MRPLRPVRPVGNAYAQCMLLSSTVHWMPLSLPGWTSCGPAPPCGVCVPDTAPDPAPIAMLNCPAWTCANRCRFLSASASFSDSMPATIFSISDSSRF